jgi:leucyl aminopeptidase
MHPVFLAPGSAATIPIWCVSASNWREIRATLDPGAAAFAEACGFEPVAGRHAFLPGADGALAGVLFAQEDEHRPKDPFLPGKLAGALPHGGYRFANAPHDPRLAALAFALGAYRFTRYGKSRPDVRLEPPNDPGTNDADDLSRIVEAVYLARDLINTPANDMGPDELAAAAKTLAARHGAEVQTIVGDDLQGQNFPLIHAVGRAAARAPRLIDLTWGDATAPRVTLVGKGVCFDSGGLDIKPDSAMLLMKKDMGGAATVLALAHMIMDRRLKVRLRVLIPAVENSISGAAMRPLDIYRARNGLRVEVGNTDAEGRLVLADALAAADEESPDLLIDIGTLTGAARVALGPDLPPFYTEDEALAADVARFAQAENDPLWRLPLWRPYDQMIDSKVGDVNNIATGGFAGSIICALFLNRFVSSARAWLHFDIYGWTPSARSGRPEGGECQAARALYALVAERYG